jgi:hypothetical protein
MNNINLIDIPVNVGVIKCGKDLILYDSGWNQTDYHKMTGTEHWSPLSKQIEQIGSRPPTSQDHHRPWALGPRGQPG